MPDLTVRDAVVAAADDLFYRRGVQAVGMDELRTAAGVSLKRLYREFESKDAIVLAVLDHRTRSWQDCVSRTVDAATTPRDKLLAIYDYLVDWTGDDAFRGCGFINTFGELGSVNLAVADAVRAHKEGFADYVARLAEDVGLDADVAPQLVLLAEGAQTMAAITQEPAWATAARAAASTLIDAGLAPRS
ncbi:TetR/AcrR family transcriptional regulator [Sanguibacter antarcticus]|uniref:TetR family transcriptional regulator n=1 Tax=Sanguibacter antarcticus TaxID=372484 RepID=A0A2A9E6R4_9MICO|nr:TetR/AcrR family transcriptional regulator [Sanguibacter antarcticus]PFG34638.1 TetR family transcriptional regulator [Sanguibacter antarcticus]